MQMGETMSSSPDSEANNGGVFLYEYAETGTGAGSSLNLQTAQKGLVRPDLEEKMAAARMEGFRQGSEQEKKSWEQQLAAERARVGSAIAAFADQKAQYFSKVEVELVHLSLGIAAKILHREAQVDRRLVAGLVRVALEKIQQNTTVVLRVHPQEVADWNHYVHMKFDGDFSVEVQGDPTVAANNCVLETELGSTELGLHPQLKEVEQGFFDLLAQRPDRQ